MMLICKTTNWLLRHSVQRCVKSRRLVWRMREITRFVKVAINVLLQSFLSTSFYRFIVLGPYARRGRKSYSRAKIDLRRTSVYAGMHDADLALVRVASPGVG